MTRSISDYALIGDGQTAALLSSAGAIAWLCWPRFDSGACFAALLGDERHGHWTLSPAGGPSRATRRYQPNTLVLESAFETDEGAVRLIDFMPVRNEAGCSQIIRIVEGVRGGVTMRMRLAPRFDYGRLQPWISAVSDGVDEAFRVRAVAGPHAVFLAAPCAVAVDDGVISAEFTVAAGEQVAFILAYQPSHLPPPGASEPLEALRRTQTHWRRWAAKARYEGPWKDAVIRSLITVKALTYQPTGGIVAAPTTSIPEEPGGSRNWDYRYCWLRDTGFILNSLLGAGYRSEACAWCDWLLRAVAGAANQIQPVYGIGGEHRLHEHELHWLPGFAASQPVRAGNAAYRQLQIDVFGFVMDTLHAASVAGLELHQDAHALKRDLLEHLARIWREPDDGIWEVRNGPRHFVHSKLMAWVAFDRAVKMARAGDGPGPAARWAALRDEVRRDILANGFDAERGVFVQSYGDTALDASLLLIPIMGFLPADDPRVVATSAAIDRELSRDGLILRYLSDEDSDGLPTSNGGFLACSFWLVDNLVLQGRLDEARDRLTRLVNICNDVGLLAEQYNLRTSEMTGNFPQAFSHFALIDSAFNFAAAAAEAQKVEITDHA